MKTIINGHEVSGTPSEIKEILGLTNKLEIVYRKRKEKPIVHKQKGGRKHKRYTPEELRLFWTERTKGTKLSRIKRMLGRTRGAIWELDRKFKNKNPNIIARMKSL
jgi:intein/homing endonuclease